MLRIEPRKGSTLCKLVIMIAEREQSAPADVLVVVGKKMTQCGDGARGGEAAEQNGELPPRVPVGVIDTCQRDGEGGVWRFREGVQDALGFMVYAEHLEDRADVVRADLGRRSGTHGC